MSGRRIPGARDVRHKAADTLLGTAASLSPALFGKCGIPTGWYPVGIFLTNV